jgi:YD repeat-containing protein
VLVRAPARKPRRGSPTRRSNSYNLAGALTQEIYPSQRKVNYGYDTAGRITSVANGTTSANYASGICYLSAGHAPDKTYSDPAKADLMAADTFSHLLAAKGRL